MTNIAVILLLLAGTAAAAAQQPSDGKVIERLTPKLELSVAARQAIYTSIGNTASRQTVPPTFRIAIGEIVPVSVKLQPLPDTVTEFFPQTRDYNYALVEARILLVEPRGRMIVEIITG